MPTCKAYGCKNSTGKGEKKSFFMIPRPKCKDEKLRCLRWLLHNIGCADVDIERFKFGKDTVVCEDHFHPDCIKKDIISPEQLKKRKKKELIPGAVPTIFVHKTYDDINMDGTKCLQQRSSSVKRSKELEHSEVGNFSYFSFVRFYFQISFSLF